MRAPWQANTPGRQTAGQRGVTPKFDMRHYNWQNLDADFVEALNRAYDAMSPAEKASMRANSGYRTETRGQADQLGMPHRASQEDVYVRSRGGRAFMAARPGNSSHGRGFAVDIERGPALNFLHARGREFGLTPITPMSGRDPVHIEAINQPGRQTARAAWPRTAPPARQRGQQAARGPTRTAAVPMPRPAPGVPQVPGTVNQAGRDVEHAVPGTAFAGPGTQSATISPGLLEMMTGLSPAQLQEPQQPPAWPEPTPIPQLPPSAPITQLLPAREVPVERPKEVPPARVASKETIEDRSRPIIQEAQRSLPPIARQIAPTVDADLEKATKAGTKAAFDAVKENPWAKDAEVKAERAATKEVRESIQRSPIPEWVKDRQDTKEATGKLGAASGRAGVEMAREQALPGTAQKGAREIESYEKERVVETVDSRAEAREAPAERQGPALSPDTVKNSILDILAPQPWTTPERPPAPPDPFVGPQQKGAQLPGRDIEPFYGPMEPKGPDLYDRDPDVKEPDLHDRDPTVEDIIEVAKVFDIPIETVMQMPPEVLAELVAMLDPGDGGLLRLLAA
jgi:hypothetical protein